MNKLFNILETTTNFCEDPDMEKLIGFLGQILVIIKIAIPVILIVIGTITLVKAMISNESESTKKATTGLIKKACIGVVIFFVPTIVNFIMGLVGQSDNACVTNFLSPSRYQQNLLEEKIDDAQEFLRLGQELQINGTTYTVKEGDTIESIAKKNNISEKNIIEDNNLGSDDLNCSMDKLTVEENCDIMECPTNRECTQIDGTWYCCTGNAD